MKNVPAAAGRKPLKKDVLETGGRGMKIRLGNVNFDIPVNASLLGRIYRIADRIDSEEKKLSAEGYQPERIAVVFGEMLDGLFVAGATRRIFGPDLPVPSDLCDALIFVVRQIRGVLEA